MILAVGEMSGEAEVMRNVFPEPQTLTSCYVEAIKQNSFKEFLSSAAVPLTPENQAPGNAGKKC